MGNVPEIFSSEKQIMLVFLEQPIFKTYPLLSTMPQFTSYSSLDHSWLVGFTPDAADWPPGLRFGISGAAKALDNRRVGEGGGILRPGVADGTLEVGVEGMLNTPAAGEAGGRARLRRGVVKERLWRAFVVGVAELPGRGGADSPLPAQQGYLLVIRMDHISKIFVKKSGIRLDMKFSIKLFADICTKTKAGYPSINI